MSPGDGIAVRPADLLTHAGHLDGVAGALAAAKDAGQAVMIDRLAYGQLCMIVPALLDVLQGRVVDGIAAGIDSLRDTADRLRAAADGYQTADAASQTVHDRIRGGL